MAPLLARDEPTAFECIAGRDASPFVLIADHAGCRVPRTLGNLGLTAADLASHIAWDIGIEGTSRLLAQALGACLIMQRYSRLVIDCNRPLESPDSIAKRSAGIEIPSNLDLMPLDVKRRTETIFRPYHDCIESELNRRGQRALKTVFVAMHSFTPDFMGSRRRWHVGVLYQRDNRLAKHLLKALRSDSSLEVGDNQPYAVSDLSDYSIVWHGERRGMPHVEIEIRQDLISDPEGQRIWAERLQGILSGAAGALESGR